MAKRLRLAKGLLADDGVIFISIDDNEQAQLKLLCDEIFGEKNFIGEVIRKTKSMTGDEGAGFNLQHENLIIFSKNKEKVFLHGENKDFESYKNIDGDINGDWVSGDPSAKSGGESTYFGIKNPFTNKIDLPPNGRYWAFSRNSLDKYTKNGKVKFKKKHKNNERGFIFKRYKKDLKNSFDAVNSLFTLKNDFMNQAGTKELKNIFNKELFKNPKPVLFISKLVQYSTNKNSKILDFFAGSGTTGHAVLELNKQDGGNRQFILCTNNENDICEQVTYERIKRVIQGYTTLKGKKIDGLGGGLKYLKTDFVKKQKTNAITDEDKIKLTYQVGCVLALKENTFNEVKKAEYYQIFSSFEQLTAIYFSENKADLSELVEFLAAQDKFCKLYVFSWSKGEYKHEFSDYSNIIAEDIPEPILDVYKSIGIV